MLGLCSAKTPRTSDDDEGGLLGKQEVRIGHQQRGEEFHTRQGRQPSREMLVVHMRFLIPERGQKRYLDQCAEAPDVTLPTKIWIPAEHNFFLF